jgi:hypothetical protein
MTEKKQSYQERMETEEMLKFEMDSDNPFADGSFRSYKAKNRMDSKEKDAHLQSKKLTILTEKQMLLREKIQRVIAKRNELPF